MYDEKQRERVGKWRHEHPEKVMQYNRDYLRRKYLDDFMKEAAKQGGSEEKNESP